MKLVSVNIGKKTKMQWQNKTIETGIFKYPVDEAVFLDKTDVRDDNVIDRKYHGGFEKAVYGYSKNHYQYWKELYPHLEFNYGMFGENLTISNLDENNIFIGNIYKLGETKIEVTQPRQPCYKLGIRFADQKIIKKFWNTTKSGIYFKVLQTGFVSVNDKLILLENKPNNLTVSQLFESKK